MKRLIQAGLTFALFALFFFFYEDEPAMHRLVQYFSSDSVHYGKFCSCKMKRRTFQNK